MKSLLLNAKIKQSIIRLALLFYIAFSLSSSLNAQVTSFKYTTKSYALSADLPIPSRISPVINGSVLNKWYLKKNYDLKNLGEVLDYYIDKKTGNLYVHYLKTFTKKTYRSTSMLNGMMDWSIPYEELLVYYQKGVPGYTTIISLSPSTFDLDYIIGSFVVLDNGDVVYSLSTGYKSESSATGRASSTNTIAEHSIQIYKLVAKTSYALAGLNRVGDVDGTGTNSRLSNPLNLALNTNTGDILVLDYGNNKFKLLSTKGAGSISSVYTFPTGFLPTTSIYESFGTGSFNSLIYDKKNDCYYYINNWYNNNTPNDTYHYPSTGTTNNKAIYKFYKKNNVWTNEMQIVTNVNSTSFNFHELTIDSSGQLYLVLVIGGLNKVYKLVNTSTNNWEINDFLNNSIYDDIDYTQLKTPVLDNQYNLGYAHYYPIHDMGSTSSTYKSSRAFRFLGIDDNMFFLAGENENYVLEERYKTKFISHPSLPDGLSLNESTGEITGTPTKVLDPLNYIISYPDKLGTLMYDTLRISVLSKPVLSTIGISNITNVSASSGGDIKQEGAGPVTERGVVWSTSTNPIYSLTTKTSNGSGLGKFTSQITGLNSNTSYFARAYAVNIAGVGYGNEIKFSTNYPPLLQRVSNALNIVFNFTKNR